VHSSDREVLFLSSSVITHSSAPCSFAWILKSLGSVAVDRLAGILPPAGALGSVFAAARPVQAFGLSFCNPLGLAAGYDKDGLGWRGLACLGFGHIEIGTVTPRPQEGNPRPRLFRLPQDQGLINRMGFPGRGTEFVKRQLSGRRSKAAYSPDGVVLGVNLGKNKDTPLEEAAQDYLELMQVFSPLADYLAINVQLAQYLGLRQLQETPILEELLTRVSTGEAAPGGAEREAGSNPGQALPDLSDAELDDAVDVILSSGMDGVIATNTTTGRRRLRSPQMEEAGGLSGRACAI
jgi:dihydroorotate dehydrogenase